MTGHRLLTIVASGFLLLFAGCGKSHSDATAGARTRQGDAVGVITREALSIEDRLRAIAEELRSGRYTVVGGWTPAMTFCAYVAGRGLDFSGAVAGSPHGMKIYQPWAKDAKAYFLAPKGDQPIGQVIIKESWVPRELAADEDLTAVPFYAERDGTYYKPDDPKELFIMFKDDPATSGTDEGWVYGIVTPDGKEAISSGNIKTCADCHRQARHDRVFGAKPKAE